MPALFRIVRTTVRLSQKVLHPLLKVSFITVRRTDLRIIGKKFFKHSWMVAARKQIHGSKVRQLIISQVRKRPEGMARGTLITTMTRLF